MQGENKMKHIIILITILLGLTTLAAAEDAREIMRHVLDRDDGTTEISRVKLLTCRYVKKDGKMVCGDNPRIKIMDLVRKDYGEREKDHKSVSIIIEPSGERGIGFLQYDYDKKDKDTDQWIYLSALGKVKRIVSGNDNEPKTGSFFGSELSYEDMEKIHLDDYTYKILGSETYRKRKCWVMESVPVKERARKSNYSKTMDWVDKERNMVLKSILFNRQGKKVKKIYNRQIEEINGILVARQMIVNNLESGRTTIMTLEQVSLNKSVADEFLTQRTLTDGSFRQSNLKEYQENFK